MTENPQHGQQGEQAPEQGEETGVDTGQPNEDLHGAAREVEENADDPTETPGGG